VSLRCMGKVVGMIFVVCLHNQMYSRVWFESDRTYSTDDIRGEIFMKSDLDFFLKSLM
jgi:hypothetical protein